MLKNVVLLGAGLALVGCKADTKCAKAVQALDVDGDLYLPGAAPGEDGEQLAKPEACADETWTTIANRLGYAFEDCDDARADVHPDAEESCDQAEDLDCDGAAPVKTTRYTDDDRDGYGDPTTASEVCGEPSGTVDNGDDCDDLNPSRFPGAEETVCGPEAMDLNCDDQTDCAVSGTLRGEDLAAVSTTEEIGGGAGRALDADDDGRVLVGGENGAWILTGAGRQLDTEALTIDGSVEAGADVCWLDVDEDGEAEAVVGDPGFDEGAGRITLGASDDTALTSGRLSLGSMLAASPGLQVSETFDDVDLTWSVYLVLAESIPAGTSNKVNDVDMGTPLSAAGSADAPPALSVATDGDGWLVAVGQPEDDGRDERAIVWSMSSSAASTACILKEEDDPDDEEDVITLGSAVLLGDITGDGATDLIVGDPGAASVYFFFGADCGGATLTVEDADFTLEGAAAGFGAALAIVPDMNGDLIHDVIIGGNGTAVLVLGSGNGPGSYATIGGSGLGASVAGGDLDDDGYGDIILGDAAGNVTVLWGGPPA